MMYFFSYEVVWHFYIEREIEAILMSLRVNKVVFSSIMLGLWDI